MVLAVNDACRAWGRLLHSNEHEIQWNGRSNFLRDCSVTDSAQEITINTFKVCRIDHRSVDQYDCVNVVKNLCSSRFVFIARFVVTAHIP